MKTYIILALCLLIQLTAHAQTTPESLLAQLPNVPSVNCASDRAEMDNFNEMVIKVQAIIQQTIDRIHADAQGKMEHDKDKIVNNAIKQSGLSNSDVQKLQQSDGSKVEGQKAVEKVVSEQYGITLQELELVSEMSEAEQNKWAQQYADNMQSQVQKNPEAAKNKSDKAKRLIELADEQKTLGEYITERMKRVFLMFKNIEQQDSIEISKLEEKLRPLEAQLCSGICTDAEIARSNAAEKQIYALKLKYCEKMSPMQTDAILQYQTTLKSLLPIYRKLTKVQNEVAKLQQIGEIVPEDLSCYAAVDEYTTVLLSAYKYWIGKFNK